MAGQPPPGGSEDDFLEHFFAFPSAASAGAAGGHAGAGAVGDHPFPLALSLDAAGEAKPVSSLVPSPAGVVPSLALLLAAQVEVGVLVGEGGFTAECLTECVCGCLSQDRDPVQLAGLFPPVFAGAGGMQPPHLRGPPPQQVPAAGPILCPSGMLCCPLFSLSLSLGNFRGYC